MDEALDRWFADEILVHEAALLRYLTRVWPRREEIHDLRQEVYVKVYEAAIKARPRSAKSFLFTTARHLLTDRLRRARIVSIEVAGDPDVFSVLVDEISPEQETSGRQELKRLAEAFDRLPDRCRAVVWLRRVQSFSQKEVAARLGISEKTVEKQLAKGARLIADHMYGGDSSSATAPWPAASIEAVPTDNVGEGGHGQQK